MTPFDPILTLIATQARVKTPHVWHVWSAIRETGASFHIGAFATFAGLEERHVIAIMDAMTANNVLPKRRATVKPKTIGDSPLAHKVIAAWNDQKRLTASRGMDEALQKHLDARIKAHGEQSVFDAIRRLGASDWHCGGNDRGWKANLSWMISSPAKFLIALELPDPVEQSAAKQMTTDDIRRAIAFNRQEGNQFRVAELEAMLEPDNVVPFAKMG
jgi:hypothetical protein